MKKKKKKKRRQKVLRSPQKNALGILGLRDEGEGEEDAQW